MKNIFVVAFCLFLFQISYSQSEPDKIYMQNIHTPMLYQTGNFYGYPIINLGSVGTVQLDFDDLDNNVKKL